VAGSIALSLTALPAQAAVTDAATRDAGILRSIRPAAALEPTANARTVASAVRSAEAAPATYTVQSGDTVSRIAARFGLRIADVLTLNGLGWSTTIHPGQVLKLAGTAVAAPAPAAPAPTAPAAPAPSTSSYTVAAGDTISSIANRHGVTTGAVLSANGLGWSSIIYPGQTLEIPAAGAAASVPDPAPAPAPAPAPNASAAGTHTVAAGDTVSGIAQRYGVTADAVLGANGLGWSSIIYPGQTIKIPSAAPSVPGLTAEQIGREHGVSDRGIAIALGTAMQESSLRNVTWGDRDSLGLFQQRPSYGWGTEAEVQDAARATRVFFGGAGDPNGSRTRGLLDIRGWEDLTFAQAAQAVQNSAYPDAYATWEAPALSWLAALG
jgi:LysM repeat protein